MRLCKCPVCGVHFVSQRTGKFCTGKCRQTAYRRRSAAAKAAKPIEESLDRARRVAARQLVRLERYAKNPQLAAETPTEASTPSCHDGT